MKTILKHIKTGLLAIALSAALFSCQNDDDYLVFTAQEPSEDVAFLNTFSDNYLLSNETRNNIAERFVWNRPDFDAPTTINYVLEGSITEGFDTVDYDSGTLSDNNHAIKVSALLTIAEALGLDTDPDTTDDSGEPNNTGVVYFRVRAFVGTDGAAATVQSTSSVTSLTISLIEETGEGSGIEISSWGVVGSAANDWGATPDLPFYTTAQANVLVAYVTLKDGAIKFRENNDWGNNFGDDGADLTLDAGGADINVSAGTYKITLDFNSNTYTIELYSLGVVGSAWNDWGNAGPDAKLYYDYTSNTFKVGVKLIDGEMKIRLNNAWDVNYGDTGADGTLESGGDNIVVTAGYYLLTVDLVNNTYTLVESSLWGIVGSGYNDWGNAGPDFTFTEVNPGIWFAENVTLIDGFIKFRVNEDWTTNLGDNDADGSLEPGGADIAVTAGVYNITLNLNDNTYDIVPN